MRAPPVHPVSRCFNICPYEQIGCQGDTTALLCGVSEGEPATYTWRLSREKDNGTIKFKGASIRPRRAGIGASQHGALYFASAFHRKEMHTRQRILLAYFCVSEATKHDIRVGGHIDIALVRENNPVRFFGQDELAKVKRRSKEILRSLDNHFTAPGPSISVS